MGLGGRGKPDQGDWGLGEGGTDSLGRTNRGHKEKQQSRHWLTRQAAKTEPRAREPDEPDSILMTDEMKTTCQKKMLHTR